jgi:hypothetical protein
LIIGIAVAAVGVGMIGGAVGQSAAEEVVLTNPHESSVSETDFQLGARQQLHRYFFK